MIAIHPLAGIGEVAPGDDLPAILAEALSRAGLEPAMDDVLVVTSKIVSKAEDRFVDLGATAPDAEAEQLASVTGKDAPLVALALREASAVVRAAPGVLITRHHLGFVMANSGVDRSNLGPGRAGQALLLPLDPDASAARLRDGLRRRLGTAPAVIISDSFGRPWRQGVTNVALGASGLPCLIDLRGETDRDGRLLLVTQIAFGDLVACAGGLAGGEGAEGVPAALVQGLRWDAPEVTASALVRPVEQDLFT
jgi:coenzyme F420-0:L-glutamate ligase / coenzyme F420-1:gamma-L-glutamate ligase